MHGATAQRARARFRAAREAEEAKERAARAAERAKRHAAQTADRKKRRVKALLTAADQGALGTLFQLWDGQPTWLRKVEFGTFGSMSYPRA